MKRNVKGYICIIITLNKFVFIMEFLGHAKVMCSLFLRFNFSLFWKVNDVLARETKKGLPFNTRLSVAIILSICCGALCLYMLII